MKLPHILLACLSSVVLALAARGTPPAQGPTIPRGFAGRWGVLLDTDSAFPTVGGTLDARAILLNTTRASIAGWSSTSGVGCQFRFELLDGAGNVVWTPGTLVNGTFTPPCCTIGMREWTLLPNQTALRSLSIPLVHNAPGSGPRFGQPLDAGHYELAVELRFIGPDHPVGNFGPGFPVKASIGVKVE